MLAWATRFGVAAVGSVAVQHSPLQIVSRGGHTVCAMLLLAALACLFLRLRRVATGTPRGEDAAEPAARTSPPKFTPVNRLIEPAGVPA